MKRLILMLTIAVLATASFGQKVEAEKYVIDRVVKPDSAKLKKQ